MKILYTREQTGQDYLSDNLLHGLRSLEGAEVVDSPRLWYLYKEDFANTNPLSIYGYGFSYCGVLDNDTVDRSDIEGKIRSKYFDLIILSRIDHPSPYLNLILENYDPTQIIIVDGQDSTGINTDFLNKGVYFKRELIESDANILPINFGFPKEKIQSVKDKTQILSDAAPSLHIFTVEQEYYDNYNKSLFGKTRKKSGWDCMRHYEILACRTIPWFEDIKDCPERICTSLPKELLIVALDLINQNGAEWFMAGAGRDRYCELESGMHDHFLKHCTTEALARYVLDAHAKKGKLI